MLATKIQEKKNEEGFTLIELLVVVIIIGILAAIAIPAFLNQREAAWQGAVESDVRNAAIEASTQATRNGGNYPAALDPAPAESEGVTLNYLQVDGGTSFTVCGEHDDLSGESITYNSTSGGLADVTWAATACS